MRYAPGVDHWRWCPACHRNVLQRDTDNVWRCFFNLSCGYFEWRP